MSDAAPQIELDLEEPPWLAPIRDRITVIMTRAALNRLVVELQSEPEERKALIRPLITAQHVEIDRLLGIAPAKPPVAAPAAVAVIAATATTAATRPDAEDVAAATGALAVLQGQEPVLRVTGAPGMPPHTVAAAVPEARPMVATWRQITAEGLYRGQWGIAVEHLQFGVAIEPPVVGDVVIVNRARGGSSQCKRIAAVVEVDGGGRYSICAVSDTRPGARATLARPRIAPQAPTPTVEPATATAHRVSVQTAARLGALRGRLTREEWARFSAHLDGLTPQAHRLQTEYLTTATLDDAVTCARALIGPAGFEGTDIAGWLQQRARATEPRSATAARVHWFEGCTPIAAPVATPESASGGTVHVPAGRNYADMTPAERRALSLVGDRTIRPAEPAPKVGTSDAKLSGAVLMRRSDVIAGAIAGGAGGEFGWEGLGTIKRGVLVEALVRIGRGDDAPAAKDAQAQLGRACRTLQGTGYDVSTVRGDDLPQGVAVRYVLIDRSTMPTGSEIVTDARASATVEVALTVDLLDDGTVSYRGDRALADKVRGDYSARTAEETLVSSDLTGWLQQLLITRHGASRYGQHWYVPGTQREAVITLFRAVQSTKWGRYWIVGTPLTTCEAIVEGLGESFMDEIADVERRWTKAREEARRQHAEVDGNGKRKRQTEDLTARGAGAFLRDLTIVSERLKGYETILTALSGPKAIEAHRARIARLDVEIRALCDDTSTRAAMLELQ